jgi:hypothetical protein
MHAGEAAVARAAAISLEESITSITSESYLSTKHAWIASHIKLGRPAEEAVVIFTSYDGEAVSLCKHLGNDRPCFVIAAAKVPVQSGGHEAGKRQRANEEEGRDEEEVAVKAAEVEGRQEVVRAFGEAARQGRCPILLASISMAATGLNLQQAASIVYITCPQFNSVGLDEQAICRVYRQGQKRSVLVYRLFLAESIDHNVFVRQAVKASVQQEYTGVPVCDNLDLPLLSPDECALMVKDLRLQ